MSRRIEITRTFRLTVVTVVAGWAIAGVAVPVMAAATGGTVSGAVKLSAAAGARSEDVVVSIEGLKYPAANGKAPVSADLVLDQKDLTFVPHVLVVPVGASVTVHNGDAVLHNVRSTSKLNAMFNYGLMKGRQRTITFDHPEVIPISCDVHSEMSAFILVKDNPFYTRPAGDGRFTITGVPPGTYTIRAWHERAGTLDQPVTVTDSSSVTVTFEFGK